MTWSALPHEPIEQLAENLWRVVGTMKQGPLKRVMTVARRDDGRLVIHSAVALDEPSMKQLEALGPLSFLLVPNGYHRIDAPRYKERYPTLAVYCPRGARQKVAERVKVDGAYEDVPGDGAVKLEYMDGVADGEGLMTVRSKDGLTLVFNDLVFNMPHAPGFFGGIMRYLTDSSGGPKVSRIARVALVKDKPKVKASLERLAATPELKRIVVSHHELIDRAPGDVLRAVAAAL